MVEHGYKTPKIIPIGGTRRFAGQFRDTSPFLEYPKICLELKKPLSAAG
jgi:hypothetical protein